MFGAQILASAVVDVGRFPVQANHAPYVVTVWGELWGGDKLPRRKYQIGAENEDIAARAGLDRYVHDMERPN